MNPETKKIKNTNHETMQNFTLKTIPDLDICVLGALELFMKEKLPKMNITYKRPLVVGSGNAEATGRIMFHKKDAVFASESDYEEKLKNIKNIDGVVLVSASGGKHAPIIAKAAKKYKKHVTLITNNKNALAKQYSDKIYIFPKQKEPYTYNTSTYMGMILGQTHENPKKIYEYITKKTAKIKYPNFANFDKFYVLVPTKFDGIKRMIQVKFIELFGRRIARDVETTEYIKHATTVVPSNELFISFGEKNTSHGDAKHRLFIPLPDDADYGTMMAISYYVVGHIQHAKPAWFKQNIEQYTKDASKIFKGQIKTIVE